MNELMDGSLKCKIWVRWFFGYTLKFSPSRPNPGRREKLSSIFIFTLLCGAAKGFMKAMKAFTKPFEAPKRSVKIKIELNFYFDTTCRNTWDVKGLRVSLLSEYAPIHNFNKTKVLEWYLFLRDPLNWPNLLFNNGSSFSTNWLKFLSNSFW